MLNSFPADSPPLVDSAQFLVIGSGVAGLYTALELSKTARVILLTKSSIQQSNTYYAQGGIASALGVGDSPEFHYQDTLVAGAGLCNLAAVKALVSEGLDRVRHLIELGVPFDQKQGELSFTREAAHSHRRILHAHGDATGRAISETLISQVQHGNITIYEEQFALALVTQDGVCHGVVTIQQGKLNLFLASAVILCTGGLGQIFEKTTNPPVATGDGMILAYQAGAVLTDLEFVQFHPTALCLPPAPPFLISESVRGEGAILINSIGERFMPGYHELAELAPRDIVARAIFTEMHRTGSSCAYLDLSKMTPELIKQRFPNIYGTCLQYGLDIISDPIPVAPAAHYMMGGVMTDLWGRTSVPGLYAAGEAAATGVHGANRLASNSLLEGLVFGGRIADFLKNRPETSLTTDNLTIHYPQIKIEYEQWPHQLTSLRQVTTEFLGIIRDETGLKEAEKRLSLEPLSKSGFQLDPAFFEVQSMIQLAGLIARASLIRTESRGAHFRSDYPDASSTWQKHIQFQNQKTEVLST
ncbi:MAG TPA: L-aspartate oxidase [Firmicutes bacterium]|jgi:L-aspartate oxidase|nr:L-aspartate oxidase [Bacillota bacterium]